MTTIQQKLQSWTPAQALTEKVAQGANLHLSYKNKNQVQFDILFFEKENRIRLRFLGSNVNWLQIKDYQKDVDAILDKLLKVQDDLSQGAWFSFYLAFSGICDAVILAWEQYEDDYR